MNGTFSLPLTPPMRWALVYLLLNLLNLGEDSQDWVYDLTSIYGTERKQRSCWIITKRLTDIESWKYR